MSGKPSKKDFANLINSVLGQNVMTEKKLERILQEAKHANDTKGAEGLFNYLRELTNAPVSNDQVRSIADMVKKSGSAEQALETLKSNKVINERQAQQIGKTVNKRGKRPRRRR